MPAIRAVNAWGLVLSFFKKDTLSLNPYPLTSITISMVLKFFSHRKHLARLVEGFTAV
jgi:hypothetical protein